MILTVVVSLSCSDYTIERASSAGAGDWTLLDAFAIGDGGGMTLIDTNTPPDTAVYRLHVTRP